MLYNIGISKDVIIRDTYTGGVSWTWWIPQDQILLRKLH